MQQVLESEDRPHSLCVTVHDDVTSASSGPKSQRQSLLIGSPAMCGCVARCVPVAAFTDRLSAAGRDASTPTRATETQTRASLTAH